MGLAQEFVAGKILKRGEIVTMVKGLLGELAEALIPTPNIMSYSSAVLPPCRGPGPISPTSPVPVTLTKEGAVHIGKEAERVYTRMEALALAAKIILVAEGK